MMMKNLTALISGVVFGVGLTVAEMTNPQKVRSFLDILGNWDPSLAFVMGGALVLTFLGYKVITKRAKPVFDVCFHIPQGRHIDKRLVLGAVFFGIGWGLVGLCPGPALAAITLGGTDVYIFLTAFIAGMLVFDLTPLKK
mgnify:CR=1 FL=1